MCARKRSRALSREGSSALILPPWFACIFNMNVKEMCMQKQHCHVLFLCLEIRADVFVIHSKAEMKFWSEINVTDVSSMCPFLLYVIMIMINNSWNMPLTQPSMRIVNACDFCKKVHLKIQQMPLSKEAYKLRDSAVQKGLGRSFHHRYRDFFFSKLNAYCQCPEIHCWHDS